MTILVCDDCGHHFDEGDRRASVARPSPRLGGHKLCPMCAAALRSPVFWAVRNDCNGPFEVFPSRADAQRALEGRSYKETGCYVAPVYIVPVDDDYEVMMLEFQESEKEKAARSSPCAT
jgi:hypothetical protein